ncbi:MAG: prolyl oligopeptidase family serine peptidase [Lacipirellulaceae bacterium]
MTPAMMDASDSRAAPYPTTDREGVVDTLHGASVADPYRWLEGDVRTDPRVAEWVQRQHDFTEAYLAGLPERAAFRERLTALWDYEKRGAPRKRGRYYFYERNDGLQNQYVLHAADSLAGYADPAKGRVLLDPNGWTKDGTAALAGYAPSEDGELVAYQRSDAGSDWRTIRVLDTATGIDRPDVLRWVKFSGVEWAPDGSGFYYNRYPEPATGDDHQALTLNPSVMYHTLGTDQAADRLVYNDPDHPDWGCWVELSEDGRHLLLSVSRGTDPQNRLYHAVVEGGSPGKLTPLVDDFDNQWGVVGVVGDTLYLQTDYGAPRKRIVRIDLNGKNDAPLRERITKLVPEHDATLEYASLVGGKLLLAYLEDVASVVRVVDPVSGEPLGTVPLPGVGSAFGFGGEQDDTETFFGYTSYDSPPSTYRYDVATGETKRLFEPKVAADLGALEVRREFYPSKDGTRVPIFLVHRRGLKLDGSNPTLLYGYGGFAISLTPSYSPSRVAWVERGGVFAVACLRGGGEYGEEWHTAGKLANKQNVFDDFLAAAEWLVEQEITSPQHLAIQGGSNGGLLVGACMSQRPELFGACVPAVGVMDMLRFHKFTAGQFWRDEYGSADDAAMFPKLRGYSPYHNVRPGVRFPATMVMTADTDDRVVPMHSFKFAAALQHVQPPDGPPVLLRVETRSGHGAGTPTTKRIEEAADLSAFLWEHIGAKQ